MHQLQLARSSTAGREPTARSAAGRAAAPERPGPVVAPPARFAREVAGDDLTRLLCTAVTQRTGPGVLQRYAQLAPAAAVPAGPNEYRVLSGQPEFEAQVVNAAARTISAPIAPLVPPTVRVSDDGHMAVEHTNLAVRQPKVFYASPHVWQASNPLLVAVNSTYELYLDRAGALEVTLADGTQRTLDRVLVRTRAVPATGGPRPATDEGMTMNIPQDCIMAAKAVMDHANVDRRHHLTNVTPTGPTDWSEFRTARAMTKWVETHDWLASKGSWGSTWAKLWDESTEARKASEAPLGAGGPTVDINILNAIAASYMLLMTNHPAAAAQAAQALGLNVYASPMVGEAYETYEISAAGGSPTRQVVGVGLVRDYWAQHIGAVVASSGGDRVTLENYARSHEGGMAAGPHYYFQMYGPATSPLQTWHAAWTVGVGGAAAGPPVGKPAQAGRDAMTAVVRR